MAERKRPALNGPTIETALFEAAAPQQCGRGATTDPNPRLSIAGRNGALQSGPERGTA